MKKLVILLAATAALAGCVQTVAQPVAIPGPVSTTPPTIVRFEAAFNSTARRNINTAMGNNGRGFGEPRPERRTYSYEGKHAGYAGLDNNLHHRH